MKRKIIKILIVVLGIPTIGGYLLYLNRCDINKGDICYIEKEESFELETNISLKVQVESEAMGEYLLDTWNTLHPEHQGAIEYTVQSPLGLMELTKPLENDIVITSIYNAAYVLDRMKDLGDDVSEVILTRTPKLQQDAINLMGTYFIPNNIDGWTFMYNQTLAESLNIDLTDADHNGLPDSFDSFEKIMEMSDTLLETLDYVFPFTFTDQYSFYPFLTSGNWNLNFTKRGMDPGFASAEFLEGLNLIEAFSKSQWSNYETGSADSLNWAYDTALYEGQTLFTMVSDWMYLDLLDAQSEAVYVQAPLPTFNGNHLNALSEIYGYMVNGQTAYPSASAEVLRILRLPQAVHHDDTHKTFIYHRNYIDELEIDAESKQNILAYNYNKTLPVIALDLNPKVLARDIYYDVDFMPILMDLYDGNITKEVAQAQFIEAAEQWHIEKDAVEDEVESTD